MSPDAFNPYAHLKAAAGDPEDLRTLARASGDIAVQDNSLCGLFEALIFARLAYANTCTPEDAGLVMAYLAIGQDMARADNDLALLADFEGEAIALLSKLADEGVALTDDILPAMVADALPAAVHHGKYLRQLMTQGA